MSLSQARTFLMSTASLGALDRGLHDVLLDQAKRAQAERERIAAEARVRRYAITVSQAPK